MKKLTSSIASVVIVWAFLITLSYGQTNCYELGYKFGLSGTRSLHGIPSKPEDDFVMPEKCRGKEETHAGIKDGVKAAYDGLGLDKEGKHRSNDSTQITIPVLIQKEDIKLGMTCDEASKHYRLKKDTRNSLNLSPYVKEAIYDYANCNKQGLLSGLCKVVSRSPGQADLEELASFFTQKYGNAVKTDKRNHPLRIELWYNVEQGDKYYHFNAVFTNYDSLHGIEVHYRTLFHQVSTEQAKADRNREIPLQQKVEKA
jgi:hypothetical protein